MCHVWIACCSLWVWINFRHRMSSAGWSVVPCGMKSLTVWSGFLWKQILAWRTFIQCCRNWIALCGVDHMTWSCVELVTELPGLLCHIKSFCVNQEKPGSLSKPYNLYSSSLFLSSPPFLLFPPTLSLPPLPSQMCDLWATGVFNELFVIVCYVILYFGCQCKLLSF